MIAILDQGFIINRSHPWGRIDFWWTRSCNRKNTPSQDFTQYCTLFTTLQYLFFLPVGLTPSLFILVSWLIHPTDINLFLSCQVSQLSSQWIVLKIAFELRHHYNETYLFACLTQEVCNFQHLERQLTSITLQDWKFQQQEERKIFPGKKIKQNHR